ncbi:OmpA family protein [Hoeflea sp.]|uniref:OmpA family protein n=1 Tax=Hoeflea sp. TaxID=1940281 RepID=UPI003A952A27
MTLTRTLLASTAISLSSLGFSYAAPLGKLHIPAISHTSNAPYLVQVQLSVSDAEIALEAALKRKAEAEATGGDVEAAQAEVEAAQAGLQEAQAAATQPSEPEPKTLPVPEQPEAEAPEAAAPQPAEEAPVEPEAPAAEAPAEPEVAPEVELPSAEPAPEAVEEPTEPEPAAPEAPAATEPAADTPVTEQNEAPDAKPAETAPAEAAGEVETQTETPAEAEPKAEEPAASGDAAPKVEAPAEEEASPAVPADSTDVAPQSEAPEASTPEPNPDAAATSDGEAKAEAPVDSTTPTETEEVLTLPVEDGAPVLDSAKEEPADPAQTDGQAAPAAAAASEPAAPPPTSDAEAQAPASQGAVEPEAAMLEQGSRLMEEPAREAQTNVTIINQIDNRTIIEVNNRTVIEHDERDRLRAGSEEVYYEQLRGGRTREVIVRPNGVQLVTISNRWGDVIQRSRIMPDGREYVLFYAEANSDGSRQAFVDPGRNLPPLRLGIPISDYILDATDAEPSAYLEFLLEPPVEQVERLYSVEEVRRSARIRDKVRRVDMDSLTFEFGKATIAEDQIQRLSDVADAMTRILDKNPAETFLIEGHTDAVGRDEANLLLSDKRAETIAVALSDVFGIPPENLVTQGYGERYLKVRTEAPERLNRRVTIRRITPLVTPVASR